MPDGVWMSKIIIPLSKADALFFALAVSLFSVQIIFSIEVGGYLLQIYLFSRKKKMDLFHENLQRAMELIGIFIVSNAHTDLISRK